MSSFTPVMVSEAINGGFMIRKTGRVGNMVRQTLKNEHMIIVYIEVMLTLLLCDGHAINPLVTTLIDKIGEVQLSNECF